MNYIRLPSELGAAPYITTCCSPIECIAAGCKRFTDSTFDDTLPGNDFVSFSGNSAE